MLGGRSLEIKQEVLRTELSCVVCVVCNGILDLVQPV